jgi:hypothetical protein
VPPVAVNLTLPVLEPVQLTLDVNDVRIINVGSTIEEVEYLTQPLLSLTVHVYLPATRELILEVVDGGVVFQ